MDMSRVRRAMKVDAQLDMARARQAHTAQRLNELMNLSCRNEAARRAYIDRLQDDLIDSTAEVERLEMKLGEVRA